MDALGASLCIWLIAGQSFKKPSVSLMNMTPDCFDFKAPIACNFSLLRFSLFWPPQSLIQPVSHSLLTLDCGATATLCYFFCSGEENKLKRDGVKKMSPPFYNWTSSVKVWNKNRVRISRFPFLFFSHFLSRYNSCSFPVFMKECCARRSEAICCSPSSNCSSDVQIGLLVVVIFFPFLFFALN